MKTFLSLFATPLLASALVLDARSVEHRAVVDLRDPACANPNLAVNFLRANLPSDDHFYSTSTSEIQSAVNNLGYHLDGAAAAVYTSQQPGTVAFFRLNNPTNPDHFYTTSVPERDSAVNNGYVLEGIAAYVSTNPTCGIPLFRLYHPSIVDHFYTASPTERTNALSLGYQDQGTAAYVLPPRS